MWAKTNPKLEEYSQLQISSLPDRELEIILENILISRSGLGGLPNTNKGIKELLKKYKEDYLIYSPTPNPGEFLWKFNFNQEISKLVTFEGAFIVYKSGNEVTN